MILRFNFRLLMLKMVETVIVEILKEKRVRVVLLVHIRHIVALTLYAIKLCCLCESHRLTLDSGCFKWCRCCDLVCPSRDRKPASEIFVVGFFLSLTHLNLYITILEERKYLEENLLGKHLSWLKLVMLHLEEWISKGWNSYFCD